MGEVDVPLGRIRWGRTSRRDAWWLQPLLTGLGLVLGFGYLTWALLQPVNYWSAPYLTPLASPLLFGEGPHAWFGPHKPAWWPASLPLIPGLFILWFPGGFRFTCYYYRGTYYKAFWADPPTRGSQPESRRPVTLIPATRRDAAAAGAAFFTTM